jgi:hypothetical protein
MKPRTKPHKNILFTFDYELFLGNDSGTAQNCMLHPTQIIADVLNKYGYQAIFFIDTTYLLQLQKMAQNHPAAAHDWAQIVAQLQRLAAQNHRIYPHIHPHWTDATYNPKTNRWQLNDLKKYRFNALNTQAQDQVFDDSVALLRTILPHNTIDGYRAGGWCIQPFTDFYRQFVRHHIRYDFSVLPPLKNHTNAQYYDFAQAPNKSIYTFENDVLIENTSGAFTEFAITTLKKNNHIGILSRLLNKILWRTGYKSIGDGQGVLPTHIATPTQPHTPPTHEMAAIELLDIVKLHQYKKFIFKNKYMHFISHPKMLTKHNIWVFERFLKYVNAHFTVHTNFEKMI